MNTKKAMFEYLLALGSSLGNRKQHIKNAIDSIASFAEIIKTSSFINTDPVGNVAVNEFLNGALIVKCHLTPIQMVERIDAIERLLGRMKTKRNEDRIIDIDIILARDTVSCDDCVIEHDHLIVPHPRMHERSFVLMPSAEIAPDWRHPIYNKTVIELKLKLVD
jgi:2-amino-4-hydroxy-6-hydroxymethyldihydropteridine diphosphokinase